MVDQFQNPHVPKITRDVTREEISLAEAKPEQARFL
jgi:hypothetical protein